MSWTQVDHDKFIEAVDTYGKDWKKVTEAVGTKGRDQIRRYGSKLAEKFRKDPTLKGAHLLEVLEAKTVKFFWTDEEKDNFIYALETYGKDWTKVMECVGTKTRQEIIGYGYSLAARIKKDPTIKGAHLLELIEKPQVQAWTEQENDRFFEALAMYGRDWDKVSEHVGTKDRKKTMSHA